MNAFPGRAADYPPGRGLNPAIGAGHATIYRHIHTSRQPLVGTMQTG